MFDHLWSSSVILGHFKSLEVDSDIQSFEVVLNAIGGWDWIGLDGMVFIGRRYSKSTFGAYNVIFFGNEPTSGLL